MRHRTLTRRAAAADIPPAVGQSDVQAQLTAVTTKIEQIAKAVGDIAFDIDKWRKVETIPGGTTAIEGMVAAAEQMNTAMDELMDLEEQLTATLDEMQQAGLP